MDKSMAMTLSDRTSVEANGAGVRDSGGDGSGMEVVTLGNGEMTDGIGCAPALPLPSLSDQQLESKDRAR